MRLYDLPAYRQVRAYWQRVHRSGGAVCTRCGLPIDPLEPMDVGHDDLDKSVIRGPEHRHCNRATSRHKADRRKLRLRTPRLW